MYFYIFEQPKSISGAKQHTKIKDYLSSIGIPGQYNTASPARSAEEITTMGLERGFNTIVAVGSDHIVNKIAKVVSASDKAVLGVIPTDENQSISRLINTKSWKDACDSLKQRFLTTTKLMYLPPNKFFITDAQIYSQGENLTTLVLDSRCQIQFNFTQIIIHPGMTIEITDNNYRRNVITKGINWLLGKEIKPNAYSIFHAKKFSITSKKSLFVLVNREIVAKSPFSMEIKEKSLKIITIRSMITLNQEKENKSYENKQE